MKMDAYFQQSVLYRVMYMVLFVLFCVYACVRYPVYCLIKLLSTLQFNKYRDITGKSKDTNSLNQPFKFPVISNINFPIQNVGLSLNLKFRKPCPY